VNDSLLFTPDSPDTAMKFNDVPGSSPLVHPINILCNYRDAGVILLQPCDHFVSGMGIALQRLLPPLIVEVKNLIRIQFPSLLTSIIFPPVLVPEAPRTAIGRHSRFCRHSGTGEENNVMVVL
jgi:hypothetical protein